PNQIQILPLLLERSVHQVINRRRPLVTWNKTFPEGGWEVGVGRRRARLNNPADRLRESFLHSQPWKGFDDRRHLSAGHHLVTPATPIKADTHRRQRNLGLF